MPNKPDLDKLFKAIADPTRREIIYLLAIVSASLTINEISDKFPASRQAITKHIKILQDADLLKIEKKGRESYCYAKAESLRHVQDWMNLYQKFWTSKLDDLESFLDSN
ncbi:ArsR/SmtB family transcription factor [Reichenbachiella versicolor]|uniref:ArsR/SmtB family transcription factor n=1 Tax=Reichenbachiella versicolor TaxID=1821036 RepID=UPI000D6E9755|nr:metalloregulator ArsR/SmtB family transcription factor [Reichenbachiella versicolor]